MENKRLGYIYITAATLCFCLTEITLKTVAGVFNPIQINIMRFLFGGLVLLPFVLGKIRRDGIHFSAGDLRRFALSGFLQICVAMTLYQIALKHVEASACALIFSINPLFILVLAYLFLGEPITKKNVTALALEIVGILFVINVFAADLDLAGTVFAVAAPLFFSVYAVMGREPARKYGGMTNTCMSFLFGACELIIFALFTNVPAIGSAFSSVGLSMFDSIPFIKGLDARTIPIVLLNGLVLTGGGFTSYFKAMENVSVNTVSLVYFFKPILTPILALILLAEPLTMTKTVGILFILAGSLVNML